MGWRGLARSLAAESRRQQRAQIAFARQQEREAVRRRRELMAQQARDQQADDRRNVALYESYLELLVSLHRHCGNVWDWPAVATSPPPPAPTPVYHREALATQARNAYAPGFFERLLGRDVARRAELDADIARARAEDAAEMREHSAAHAREVESWRWLVNLANGIQAAHPAAFATAMEHLVDLDEMEEQLGSTFTVSAVDPDAIVVDCVVQGDDLVPHEELSLNARGKLSSKKMAQTKYWALYQDHVCSCALRVARETFALLPVRRVVVNVGANAIDSSTGHPRLFTYLAVHFTRDRLSRINFGAIDPSDSMSNFDHRMSFKKSSGFAPVEPMTLGERWVTTG